MSLEIAVVVAYIGIVFALIYLANSISDEYTILVALKVFLYSASILLMYYASSVCIVLLDYGYMLGVRV